MLRLNNSDFENFDYYEIGKVIRCTKINNDIWFPAIDVCKILEYKNPTNAVTRFVDKSKSLLVMGPIKPNSNYVGKMVLITYGALNKLVINSRMSKAKEFSDWILEVVMPSIHYNKSFSPVLDRDRIQEDPDQFIKLVSKKIMTDENMIKGLQIENSDLRKKSILSKFITNSDTNFSFGEFSNILSSNGYNIGLNRLYNILRDAGYLISTGPRKNMPTQKSLNQNLINVNISVTSYGSTKVVKSITPKGAEKFVSFIDDQLSKKDLKRDTDGQYRDEEGFIVLKPTAEFMTSINRIARKQ